MSLAMYAAPFDNDNRITEPKHNSTQKNHSKQHNNTRKSSSGKVNVLLEQIHNQSDTDDNDEQTGGLADFNPVPKPISSGVTRTIERDAPIDDISVGEDDAIPSQYAKQYYQQYAPSFNSNSVPVSNIGGGEQSNMIEKMNYMIHLLEEQQDQKTNHVTEEIILYSFLGVFVIFVVDSFARVGKYVR
jgi:hypothetical protein